MMTFMGTCQFHVSPEKPTIMKDGVFIGQFHNRNAAIHYEGTGKDDDPCLLGIRSSVHTPEVPISSV